MKRHSKYKWEVLVLLWFAFFHNQAGRQVFNIVIPSIKNDLLLTDTQIGTIATVYNLIFAVLVPFAGYLGDRYSRKWIVVLSVLFFSGGLFFTGWGTGMLSLLIFRGIISGGSDPFLGPPQYSLLASYHKKSRAFAMSIHQTSFYIGILVIGFSAGFIAEEWGWRMPFFVTGAIGIILGIVLIVRLKDKISDQTLTATHKEKPKFFEGLKVILRTPTAIILTIGFCGLIFVITGYLTWMPTYLFENFDLTLSMAGFSSMFYTHLFAFVGILIAGKYSDTIAKKRPAARMLMQGIALLIAAPFIIMMGHSSILILIYIGFAGFGFARAFFDANTWTVLYDVIPEEYHSSATGMMSMLGFGFGSLAPIILGVLKPLLGLSFGITSLAFVWIICGLLLLFGYKYTYEKDYKKCLSFDGIDG